MYYIYLLWASRDDYNFVLFQFSCNIINNHTCNTLLPQCTNKYIAFVNPNFNILIGIRLQLIMVKLTSSLRASEGSVQMYAG
jgi:hypothetical protein